MLSGLVVKGSFFLILRLWFYVLPALPAGGAAILLGALGSAAIIVGSVLALRQARLKLLIAYSTMAQIGYLFLVFPLATGAHAWSGIGWSAGMMQVLAHAFAKAAMFFSAGLLAEALGHDQIGKLTGAARVLPVTFLTLGLGGLSLMGLPPSGGFSAKWLMLQASVASGQWVWSLPVLAGGLLAGGLCLSHPRAGLVRRRRHAQGAAATQPRGDRARPRADRAGPGLRAARLLRLS